ncbi:MAG: N-acetyltransferase [Thermoguttaceae bacterium]|nr:N-acetyltransferase [Thermoguttaceae bacterium]
MRETNASTADGGALRRPSGAKIRWATRADAAALRRIYSYYVEETTVSFECETPSVAEMERRIAEVDGVYPFLVCVVEEENGKSGENGEGEESGGDLPIDACDAAAKIDKNGVVGKIARSLATYERGEGADGGQVGERVVGYALAHRAFERAAYSWVAETAVYVDRDWRRRGIGEALYSALIEILEAQGVRTLYAVVVADNKASVEFHRRAGYRDFATFKDAGWKFGRWLDVVWLERTLGVWREKDVEKDVGKGVEKDVENDAKKDKDVEKDDAKKDAKTGENDATEGNGGTLRTSSPKRSRPNPAPTPVRPISELPEKELTSICAAATRRLRETGRE